MSDFTSWMLYRMTGLPTLPPAPIAPVQPTTLQTIGQHLAPKVDPNAPVVLPPQQGLTGARG